MPGENTGTGVPATRLGATPKARMLWLLAKSFARCKTNRASNVKHPFYKNISFLDRNETTILCTESWFYCYYIICGLYNVIVRRILHIAVYQVLQCHAVKILVYDLVQPLP